MGRWAVVCAIIKRPGGVLNVTRMIKDYVEVGEHVSLDALISHLTHIRDGLSEGADARMHVRGDAVFGRHICVGFMRPLTVEEAAVEGRYGEADRPARKTG
jgi:hypothetical protein